MLPPLLLPPCADAVVAADAAPHANACAAAGAAPPAGRTAALFAALSEEFAAQRARGVHVGSAQDAASLAELDAALRRHLAAYCADAAADWQRCGEHAQRARFLCRCVRVLKRRTSCRAPAPAAGAAQVRLLGRGALRAQPGSC
jgi:hypothetical protein